MSLKQRAAVCLSLLLLVVSQGVAVAAQTVGNGPTGAPGQSGKNTTTTAAPTTTTTVRVTTTAPTATTTTTPTPTTSLARSTTTSSSTTTPPKGSPTTTVAGLAQAAPTTAMAGCPVPAAATALTATAGTNQATVTWTAAADNGSVVTRYLVTAFAGTVAKNSEATDGAATSVVLSGLPGGTPYTFKVVASSACGDGPAATSPVAIPTGAAATYVSSVLSNAPSAYYRLGETTGQTAADSSGKGRHGTYQYSALGSPGALLGDPDTAVGTNGWGRPAAAAPALPLLNSARTVAAWVKPADTTNRYVAGWGAYGTNQEFSVFVGPTTVGVVVYNNDRSFTTPRRLNDGTWHHVAVTYDGTTLIAYLDGLSLGSRTFGAPLDTVDSAGLSIGARFQGEAPFYGSLDEVAVFPAALTAAQVGAHFSASGYGRPSGVTNLVSTAGSNQATVSWSAAASPTPVSRYIVTAYAGTVPKNAQATDGSNTSLVMSGLSGGTAYTFQVTASNAHGDGPVATTPVVTPTGAATTYASSVLSNAPAAYYRLGEDSGQTAADSSGKGRHATYEQAALGSPGAVTGDPDTAATGNGGARMAMAAPSLPLYNTARTVEAWVKPADATNRYVASWGGPGYSQEFSLVTGRNTVGVVVNNDDRYFPTPRPLDDGLWHHVAVTYDGTTLTAYLDGAALGTRTFAAPLDTLDGSGLHIGARSNGQTPYYGGLDEVAVFPTALTAAQVIARVSAGGYGPPGAVTDLVATAGDNQATVAWSPPASPTPLTRFVVTAYAGAVAKNAQATDASNTSVVISGLPGGTAYTFKVVASNAYGDGPAATSPVATPTGAATTYASSVLANAPSAYYRLGDDSGRTAADSSGKGRHGTYERATLGSPGAVVADPDAAVTDDGGGRAAGAAPALPLYNSARSVEAWVKPADAGTRYLASWGGPGYSQEFSLYVTGTTVGVVTNNDDRSFPTPGPLNDGLWHHVAVTYDGTTLIAYVDGASLGTRTFAAPLDTLDKSGLHIGARLNGESFYGALDEVAVYPTALAAAAVSSHFSAGGYSRPAPVTGVMVTAGTNSAEVSWTPEPSPVSPVTRYVVTAYAGTVAKNSEATDGANTSIGMSGLSGGTAYTFQVVAFNAYGSGAAAVSPLVTPTGPATTYVSGVLAMNPSAYYRLGDGSGRTAADSSGKGRHGLYDQATLGGTGAVLNDPDSSTRANSTCCVAKSSPLLPVGNAARSVEAWVKPADTAYRSVAGWGTATTDRSFSVGVDPNRIGVSAYSDDRFWPTPAPLNDGAWHHVVVVYTGATLTAYLDGASLGTRTFAAPLSTLNNSGLVVGADFQGGAPFNGGLDEVAVYPIGLSPAQVTAQFTASGFSRPAAVTNLTATPGANQATVSWSPASSPNAPVTRYVVTAHAGTVAKNAEATSGTNVVVSGLAGGTSYTFKVVAANAYGDGAVATSPAVTPTGPTTTYVSGVLALVPSAYYRLGEGSGRTAADSSGKGRHGVYEQATLGRPGAVLGDPDTAAGANGYCCVAKARPILPAANTARSIEAWVKPTDASFRYIAGWGAAATDRSFSVGIDGNRIGVIAYNDDRYWTTPGPLNDGAWHHVVVTYSGASLTAYLDGTALGTRSFSAPLTTLDSSGLFVGADFQGGAPFYGALDEVAVYPAVLNATQVAAHFADSGYRRPAAATNLTATAGSNQATVAWSAASSPTAPVTAYVVTAYAGTVAKNSEATKATSVVVSGLEGGTAYTFKVVAANAYGDGPAATSAAVTPTGPATTYVSKVLANGPSAYYRLGEGSGRTSADSSGKGRHGAYGQATLGAAGSVAGDPDTSVGANGGCCVAQATPALPGGNAARSVQAWVRPTDPYFRYIAGWGTAATDRSFSVGLDGTNIGVIAYNNDRYFALPRALNDGAWHHVVVTYDGTNVVAYVDGVALGIQRFSRPLTTLSPSTLRIGADFQGSSPFYGGLDEVAVYPVALTAAQIGATPPPAPPGGPNPPCPVPAAPTGVTASAGVNQATVNWTAAADNGSAITRYVVTANAGAVAKNAEATAGAETSVVLSGLSGGTAHTFQVMASSACGDGPVATSAAVTPTGVAATYASSVLANAPSAYYRLGENTGSSAADSSANRRHGTYDRAALGAPGAVPGDPDTSVTDDGAAKVAGSSAALPLYNSPRSVEAWVKPEGTYNRYVASWGSFATDQEFSLLVGPTTIGVIAYNDDRYFTTPRPLNDGVWHHVVVTYDGATLVAYLDGASLGTRTFASALDTLDGYGLKVGSRFPGWEPFIGGLDEVAVFPAALTAAQVGAHFSASGYAAPSAPRAVTASYAGDNRMTVSWGFATSEAAPVTRYLVTAYAGTTPQNAIAVSGTKTAVRMTGLKAGTPYTFQVVATNAYGDGPAATSAAATPEGAATTYASSVLSNLPSAYYRLGETSGQTAADSSGKGRHGTYERPALGASGAVGDSDTAVTGDGGIRVAGSAPSLPLSNSARSVEAWVRPTDAASRYVASWGAFSTGQEFSILVDANTVGVVAFNDDRYFPTARSLNDGAWHHVVVTYDGSTLVAYVDGLSLGTRTFAAPLDTMDGSGLHIGARLNGGAPIYGDLDEVAVFPAALTAAQVSTHFAASGYSRPATVTDVTATAGANSAEVAWTADPAAIDPPTRYVVTAYAGTVAKNAEATEGSNTSLVISGLSGGTAYTFRVVASNAYGDGPVATSNAVTPTGPAATYASSVLTDAPSAYYRLGEGSGRTAADSSGRARHGTYGVATLDTAGAVVGDPDTAVVANGCCVATSAATLPASNAARSVEAWVKPADGASRYVVSTGAYGVRREFSLFVEASTVGVVAYGDDRYFTTPRPINDGAWHHVAVTYTGATLTAYLDGLSLGSRTFAAPLDTMDGPGLHIGSRFGAEAFYGAIDEVAVYPVALSAAQVAGHFAASGLGRPALVTNLTATPGNNEAIVSWSPAASQVPVAGYLVTAYAGTVAKLAEATDGANTSLVVSGLSGGTPYTFKVMAWNSYGDGPVATSAAVTPTGGPTTYASTVVTDAPSAYYRLGDGSGRTAADSSGKGRHGIYNQGALGVAGAVVGDPDTATTANGGCCVARSSPTLPAANTPRSVEAWVKPNDASFRYVAGWGTASPDRSFSVGVDAGRIGVVAYGDDRYFTTPRPLNDGAWHHVVVTYTGATLTAYLDGVSLGTRTFASTLSTQGASALSIGADFQGSSPFYGGLDEVAVYPVALTAAQVTAHFAASGLARPGAVTSLTASPGANQATVSWSGASSPNTPVTRYVVTAYAGAVAKNSEATDGANTSLVVSGLPGGTAYTFQVVAANAYGDGAVATSGAVTPTGSATTYVSSVLANAPSAYYRLGDSSGRTAADSSGKGRHARYDQVTLGATGAVVGDPDTATGANGGCCVARATPTLPAANTARSVEAWVKPSDASLRYIAGWGTTATDRGFAVSLDGTNIGVVAYGDDRYFALPRALNDGAWHHVVVTYSGASVMAYLDGVSLGSQTFSAPLATPSSSELTIGSAFGGWSPFYGSLDEVAVYPVALTAAQVTAHFSASGFSRPGAVSSLTASPGANQATVSWSGASSPNTPVTRYVVTAYAGAVAKNSEATDGANTSLVVSGLQGGTAYTFQVVAANAYGDGAVATSVAVTPTGSATTYVSSVLANAPSAYYRLGDSSGRTAADSSGKGRHARYDQVTLGATGAVVGDPDTAATANGSCCVARATPTLPAGNTARSVEAWVKPSDTSRRYIAGWGTTATDRGFALGLDGANIGVVAYNDDRNFALPRALNDGAWHHIVVTYNGTTAVAYLDGVSLGAQTFSAPLSTPSSSELTIGSAFQGWSPFYGNLDEVAVYPVALTAAQVTAHYNARP